MKTKFLFTALIAALLTVSGCKKDDECTIKCLNGGQQTENCGCQCTLGYKGEDCSKQKTPITITLDYVNIYSFPSTNPSGGSWDADGSAPDLYVKIINLTTGATIFQSGNAYYQDAAPLGAGDSYSWTAATGSYFEPFYDYSIEMYDDDIGTDDILFQTIFTPYSANNRFPSRLLTSNSSGGISFDVRYQW